MKSSYSPSSFVSSTAKERADAAAAADVAVDRCGALLCHEAMVDLGARRAKKTTWKMVNLKFNKLPSYDDDARLSDGPADMRTRALLTLVSKQRI